MKKQIRKLINWVVGMSQIVEPIEVGTQRTHLLIGKMFANIVREHGVYENIHDAEFQVFSQFGDDGIIQYLIEQSKPEVEKFIEFGVENYTEANTRFLLLNNNWSGLIIDGNQSNIDSVQHFHRFRYFDLQAVAQFIDRDNINTLFEAAGYTGEIGLLSIDIDGNDYWIWEAINIVNPVIVVIEYNSVFGAEHAVTISYDPEFNRARAHYSLQFWGASLKALCKLAEKKGYFFVGCNSNGNNAYFIRQDKIGNIPVITPELGYVESKFRDSHNIEGNKNYLRGKERLEVMKDMQVFDLETGQIVTIKKLFNLG